jgi:hypothetical protein
MKGIVKMINPKTCMVAVELETNDFAIIETRNVVFNVDIGDIIIGNFNCLSGESVKNISKDETMNVLIKDINCNSEGARKLMK